MRVWVQRGARWVLDQYRNQDIRGLVTKARVSAAQLLMPPDAGPQSVRREAPSGGGRAGGSPDAVAGMSAGVALRDLALVDSLLAQLETMEASEGDPDALARLYQLDHLAARMRRNAENLRVLVGREASDAASGPSPVTDVIRAAMSSIEQYRRITIGRVSTLAIVDAAADDLSRLLAELLDNATSYSPPSSPVAVSARPIPAGGVLEGGILLLIEDAGPGIPAGQRHALNAQFHSAPKIDSELVEQTGLAVVCRLAGKHGIRVRLDAPEAGGTTAVVLLPRALVCEPPATPWFADAPAIRTPPAAPARTGSLPAAGVSPGTVSPGTGAEARASRSRAATRTRNGLPRRDPHSLREFASFAPTVPRPREDPGTTSDAASGAAREQLLSDLDDFRAGEQAARASRPQPDTAEGTPE